MDSTRAFYAEKLGYLYGLIFAYRQEMVEILNDNDLPNNDKLLYCLIYADNFAKLFECVHFARLCLYLLS